MAKRRRQSDLVTNTLFGVPERSSGRLFWRLLWVVVLVAVLGIALAALLPRIG